jgi:Na+-transporting NADH:ubiquinone oxidoreductase subunit NqrC
MQNSKYLFGFKLKKIKSQQKMMDRNQWVLHVTELQDQSPASDELDVHFVRKDIGTSMFPG